MSVPSVIGSDLVNSERADAGKNVYDVLFSRGTMYFAVFSLAASCILPRDGLGVTICWFKSWFALPCPGCGLTRSVTCITQLEFQKAWNYHPFGILVYILLVANVTLFLFVPYSGRMGLKSWMACNGKLLKPAYLSLVFLFLAFGLIRLFLQVDSVF